MYCGCHGNVTAHHQIFLSDETEEDSSEGEDDDSEDGEDSDSEKSETEVEKEMIRRIYGRSVRSYDFDEGVFIFRSTCTLIPAHEGLGTKLQIIQNLYVQMRIQMIMNRVRKTMILRVKRVRTQMILRMKRVRTQMNLRMKRVRTQSQSRVRLRWRRK